MIRIPKPVNSDLEMVDEFKPGARLLLVFTICLTTGFNINAGNAAERVDTTPAKYQSVERERVLDGVIQAINKSTVSAQISARVAAIHFDVDDTVEQGALIVEFEDTEFKEQLNEALANQRSAISSLEEARAQFNRIENLFRRKTVSQADFDRAKAELGNAEATVDATAANVAQARRQLEYTKVRAPYGGIVTHRHIELGESANPGTPLMSGLSLDALRVTVNFPQRLIDSVEEFHKARVLLPGGREVVAGEEAITVFPYAIEGSGTIPVRILLPRHMEGLFPGILVKVAFAMGKRLRLAVPESSLVYRSEVVGVYVVDASGKISLRHVRSGNTRSDGTVEILSGLDEGEQVALNPAIATSVLKQQALLEQ
ncbi:MAG: hemolysin D [marine bacterium B5-7]|nr:MAG: hemolysin D [marine bacterium B5-7]